MALQRLDKIVASGWNRTRREARDLVRAGRVLVDGAPVLDGALKLDPDAAGVTLDGAALDYRPVTWVMLNKPAGYLTATHDRRFPTVMDLLPPELRHLRPVGRLDKTTEGLLLLTNDGAAVHALLSPKRHVAKVYRAEVGGTPTEADVAAFREGLELSHGLRCLPAELEVVSQEGARSVCLVTVWEGKFHQVKRMLAAIGNPVLHLERIKMGNLPLDMSLKRGSFRFLTAEEVASLTDFS